MAVPFDTLKLARRLEAAGFPAQQAGDMADAFAEALSQLVTKADLAATKVDLTHEIGRVEAKLTAKIERVEAKLTVLMWAVGINSALTIAILGVLLRAGVHVP